MHRRCQNGDTMKHHFLSLVIATTLSFNSCHSKEATGPFDPKTLDEIFAQRFTPLQKSIDQQKLATEKQNALLEENNKLIKTLLTVMLQNAQQEHAMLAEAQRETEEEQKLHQQKQARRQQLLEEYQNRPWYRKAWDVASHLVTAYVVDSLLPEIKRGITIRLAEKGVQFICNGIDIVTGEWVEHWDYRYACRPGEWLLKTPAGQQQAQAQREFARKHPDISNLSEQLNTLQKELYPDIFRKKLQHEVDHLRSYQQSNTFNQDSTSSKPQHEETQNCMRPTLQASPPTIEEAE